MTATAASAAAARGYQAPAGVHDEMTAPDGAVRPHWRPFLERLRALGPAEMERRWQKARHLIHENGVSYNVYGDPRGMERPWSLSPVPVLLTPEEWAPLAAGMAQRARLLDLLLADLFGPQRSLTEGWLPPELVFCHPSFLRSLHGVKVTRGCWLPLHGVDVVRAPDGRWRALADRTQAPSGAGYALENRIVVARVLPDLFREHNVERLALFFRAFQETLREMAPHHRDHPRVVLLTPGPYNATYFEQAYLAQYLGYTLAGGGDLTVRDDRVYLKTLSGLQPVDVILRRVNDDYCDPLELRPESVLGVPGLVQAVRQGNVALANPLGAGLVQTAAILPYLPRIARHLLGEELQLPAAETYWCGDPAGLAAALARFDELVLKPTFADGFTHPIFVGGLAAADRAALRARVEASPRDWVAQEQVAASTTPSLEGEALVPRALVLRGYTIWKGDRHLVMPGALARVAGTRDNPEVSMQKGAGSKDTWVLSSEPVSAFSLLPPPSHPVELTRGGGDLASRAADNLYWLGRYAERAEGIARMARVVIERLQTAPGDPRLVAGSELGALFRALGAQTELEVAPLSAPIRVGHVLPVSEEALLAALLDPEKPGRLGAVGRQVMRVARMVRDRLSADTWRVLVALDDQLMTAARAGAAEGGGDPGEDDGTGTGDATGAAAPGPRWPPGAAAALFDRAVLTLAAFSGLAMESMTRSQAWRFLDMGRRLERATTLALLLGSTLVERAGEEPPLLEAILEIADSGMTYRRRYLANMQVAAVLDLLLTDESNPRSVLFQLRALLDHLAALPGAAGAGGLRAPHERVAIAALAELQLADPAALAVVDGRGRRQALAGLLERLGAHLPALSDALSSSYLSHAAVSRHLRMAAPAGDPAPPTAPAPVPPPVSGDEGGGP